MKNEEIVVEDVAASFQEAVVEVLSNKAIKAAKEKLMESAQKLFAKVYEQAQGAQAGPNPGAGQQANQGGKEDIQDADFEEVK